MSFDPTLIPLAAQRNAKAQSDAFADLTNWTNSIKQTDEDLKKKENTGNKVIAQVRSKRQKHVVRVDSDGSEIEDSHDEDQEEEERVKMAADYKDQGNAHFKNGTFDKAVECYTMAQSLDIANPVYPANRAMANLKLKNWKEAEEDCTRALRHDPTYEKALFRRAQARDQLGKLEGAEKDYSELLKLDPKNRAARKEIEALKKRLHKKIKFTTERPENFSKTKLREIKIKEINKPQNVIDKENEEKRLNRKIIQEKIAQAKKEEEVKKIEIPVQSNKSELPKAESSVKIEEISTSKRLFEDKSLPDQKQEKVENIDEVKEVKNKFTSKPTTSFELERDWRSFSNKSTKAAYLKFIDDPISIAHYFAPQLPKYIIDICSVMSSDLSRDLPGSRLSLEILKEISQVPRFKTSLFFLLDSEKEIIKQLFDQLATQVTIPKNLKSAFLV